MAMTNCRECDAQVSTEATTCPHCGVPRPASAQPTQTARSSTEPAPQPVPAEPPLTPALSASPAIQQVVVVAATRSIGISILLTVLFGPLGMLYSTIPGALIMAVVTVIFGVITLGFGLLITWPICILWGAIATGSHNKKIAASAVLRPPALSTIPSAPAPTDAHSAVSRTAAVAAAVPLPEAPPKVLTTPFAIGLVAAAVLLAVAAWVYLNRTSKVAPTSQPTASAVKTGPSSGGLPQTLDSSRSTNRRAPLLGEWHAVPSSPNPPMPDLYLKTSAIGTDGVEVREGFRSGNEIVWRDAIRVVPVGEKALAGKIAAGNFRATHGAEFEYAVTLTSPSDGELLYTVTSDLGKEVWRARRAPSAPAGGPAAKRGNPTTALVGPDVESTLRALVSAFKAEQAAQNKSDLYCGSAQACAATLRGFRAVTGIEVSAGIQTNGNGGIVADACRVGTRQRYFYYELPSEKIDVVTYPDATGECRSGRR